MPCTTWQAPFFSPTDTGYAPFFLPLLPITPHRTTPYSMWFSKNHPRYPVQISNGRWQTILPTPPPSHRAHTGMPLLHRLLVYRIEQQHLASLLPYPTLQWRIDQSMSTMSRKFDSTNNATLCISLASADPLAVRSCHPCCQIDLASSRICLDWRCSPLSVPTNIM
jgi:hypothetical protein